MWRSCAKKNSTLTRMDDCRRCLAAHRPGIILHAAATHGGVRIYQLQPGSVFYENLLMGAQLMEAAREAGVAKFVADGLSSLEGKLAFADPRDPQRFRDAVNRLLAAAGTVDLEFGSAGN